MLAKNYPKYGTPTVAQNNTLLTDPGVLLFDAWHLDGNIFIAPSEFFPLIPSSSVKRTATRQTNGNK